MKNADPSLAVLISGGLDSAILLGDALRHQYTVFPLFLRCGLQWEAVEIGYLQKFLKAVAGPGLQPLTILEMPVVDLYGDHWSITGRHVPDAQSPDEAVFLPGRNVLLLAKALLWCHLNKVPEVALGSLQSNPFADATLTFFQNFQAVVNTAIGATVEIRLPFARMKKKAVMHLGRDLPLQFTFSCIQPVDGKHCGRCNKCAERRQAFRDAGMPDPSEYVDDDT